MYILYIKNRKENAKMKFNDILSRLDKVRKCGTGYIACCPAHDDKHPSLSIKKVDGKILMYCHAGCEIDKICTALDIRISDLFTKEYGDYYGEFD